MNRFWRAVRSPAKWVLSLAYLTMAASVSGSVILLVLGEEDGVLAYVLFAAAALSLAYSVFTVVLFVPHWRHAIVTRMERHTFTYALLRDFGFRTLAHVALSFGVSVAYGGFHAWLGISNRSIWYGALAAYYIILALLRGAVLFFGRRQEQQGTLAVYRICGILLIVLDVALSAAIAQMIFNEQGFVYYGWTVYAFAAYAFYKITMSVVNLIRAQQQDLAVRAVRNIHLADAAVSVLALQTALLSTFGDGVNTSFFNALTGTAVSLLTLGIGIFMIVRAPHYKTNTTLLQNANKN